VSTSAYVRAAGGGEQVHTWLWSAAIGVGLGAASLFLLFPETDLAVARIFHSSDEHPFVGQHAGFALFLRWFFVFFYFSCVGIAILGLAITIARTRTWVGLTLGHWLFFAVCLGIGPGLVANVVMKDQWGRARPSQVVEFGGHKLFTPALIPARQCARNCSFVSGEAASIFVVFYAAALMLPRWSLALVAIGTFGGLGAGLVRMSQGAHFLSDVIFAGVFMALTALAIHKLLLGRAQRLRHRLDGSMTA
jgi:lipid A 4'-phosphatase